MTRFARFGIRNKKAHDASQWEELKDGGKGQAKQETVEDQANEDNFDKNKSSEREDSHLKGVKQDTVFKISNQKQKSMKGQMKNKMHSAQQSWKKKHPNELECYNCGKKGHKVSQCTEPSDGKELEVQCYNCKEKGHKAFKCPKPVRSRNPKGPQMQKNKDKKKSNIDFKGMDKEEKEKWKAKRSEQRRQQRQKEAQAKLHCFNCRESGHKLSECPELQKDVEQGTDICFKCGSTEHTVRQCHLKLAPGEYPYAKCFICGETGHLSKKCPDNPRGLYPNGGCCKECGSVEHLQRDCPEFQRKQGIESVTLERLAGDTSVDMEKGSGKQKTKPYKPKGPKIVKF